VWRVPGAGIMAGTYEGRDAIFRFLARLPKETDGTYHSELVDVLASDERAAALYRARGTRHGRTLELDQVLLFRFADGLVAEVLALPGDPDAFEAFWA
jgi:ketosteroid isomerase-like protein